MTRKSGGDLRSHLGFVNNRSVTYEGRTQTVKQWAQELGISQNAMTSRVRKLDEGQYTIDQVMMSERLPRGWSAVWSTNRRPPLSQLMMDMFSTVPYSEDPFAQCVVESHRGEGIELDRIGELYGLSRERVRQIEMGAMRKLRRMLGRDVAAADIIATLRDLDGERKGNAIDMLESLEYGECQMKQKRKEAKP